MDCPKCGRKAITTSEICFYCGHNMNEPYDPEVHDKGPAGLVEEPARLTTAEREKKISDSNKPSQTRLIVTIVLSVVFLVVIVFLLANLGGVYNKYFGPPELNSDTEWVAYEISLIQKAQDRAKQDIQRYMNFQQLVDAGYLNNMTIESVDATRIVTAHGIYELDTDNPESTYLIYADTQDGERSWTIDQDSKDQYEELKAQQNE